MDVEVWLSAVTIGKEDGGFNGFFLWLNCNKALPVRVNGNGPFPPQTVFVSRGFPHDYFPLRSKSKVSLADYFIFIFVFYKGPCFRDQKNVAPCGVE